MTAVDAAALTAGSDTGRLSCYTAALVGWFLGGGLDGPARLAASVRLAVRPDPDAGVLSFSHHDPPLDVVGEQQLSYAGAPDAARALEAVEAELHRLGRVIVVGGTGRLPWSPDHGGASAPHWLLLDGREPGRWHVTDRFDALLPTGPHLPYAGWLADDELVRVLAPAPLSAVHRMRDAHALGRPVPLPPENGYRWLELGPPSPRSDPGPHWRTGTEALALLGDLLGADPEWTRLHVEDVWVAARHRVFLYDRAALTADPETRSALRAAARAWQQLPMKLRYALESHRRGRYRGRLVNATFAELAGLEEHLNPKGAG